MSIEIASKQKRLQLASAIEKERAEGKLLHDFPKDLKTSLTKFGLFTIKEVAHPGSFLTFLPHYERELAYNTIATCLTGELERTPQFAPAIKKGTLGQSLREVFNSVTHIHGEGLYMASSPFAAAEQKGISTAEVMRFSLPDQDHAHAFSVAAQAMLSRRRHFYPITTPSLGKQHFVEIGKFNEHASRSLSRAVEAVGAKEDRRNGIYMPTDKFVFEDLVNEGMTATSDIKLRMSQSSTAYFALKLTATYIDREDLEPRQKPRIIHTDTASMEGMRDIFNGLIHDKRGGSHLNLEQHPDVTARPFIEDGIDLRRDEATLEDVARGPMQSRVATIAEKRMDEARNLLKKARQQPILWIGKTAAKLPGGIGDALASGIDYLPALAQTTGELGQAYNEWQRRCEKAQQDGQRLDELANRLRRQAQGLPIWPEG